MKHIFTVHSPITFFSALAIIKHEQLDEKDVIILTAGYKPPIAIGTVVIAFQDTIKHPLHKLKHFNVVKSYDHYISKITSNSTFFAYIDLMHAYQRILVTHPLCANINFMEEGTASYVLPDNLNFMTNAARQVGFRSHNLKSLFISISRVLRGYTIRLLSLPFQPQSYTYLDGIQYYCFSDNSYPGILDDKRIVLSPTKDQIHELGELVGEQNLDGSIIWVEESYPTAFGVPEEKYRKAIRLMVDYLKIKEFQKVYIKLRPNSVPEQSILYQTLKESGVSINTLSGEVIAEAVFLTSENLTVVGLVSSLLFYAAIWGHEAISFLNFIENRPETAFDRLGPYWNKVNLIEVSEEKSFNA